MKLFGKNPAIERLRSNPKSIRKIHLEQGFKDSAVIYKKAKLHNIPVYIMPKSKMQKVGRHANSQGVVVDVVDYEYQPYKDLLEYALKKGRTLVFLDRLNDPQNLGAILRSLACLGKFSVVLPTHDSVSVTEAVLRVASGGDNHVPIAKVSNLKKAIREAQKEGFQIMGAFVDGDQPLDEIIFPHRLGVVIGSEQSGISDVIRKQVDLKIMIPMHTESLSFNAAHATSIICYEITKQKNSKKS